MQAEVVASIIAAATALAAVLAGPFIAIRASRTQMLGPMRQAWINSLRDTVSEYMASISIGSIQPSALLSSNEEVRHAAERARIEHAQKTYQLKEKVCLLINPRETDHQELVRLIESAYAAFETRQDTSAALRALRTHTQIVLKKEWDVVKE